jgi:hypothetical protein
MKLSGPIITLIAGAGLAGVLLVANLQASPGERNGSPAPVVGVTDSDTTQPGGTAAPNGTASTAPAVRRGNYAGHVPGAGQLALVVRDGEAIAYLCNGRSVEVWLQGTATGGMLQLSGQADASLVGRVDADHAAGTVVVNRASLEFDISSVTEPSGLYRATTRLAGATVRAGWIVLPDGSQVGVLTTDGSGPQPAPRLDVGTRRATIDGVPLTAVPIDGDTGSGF